MIGPQQLDGVAEGDALGSHHPVDGRAARATGAEAMPEVLRGRDDQRRVVVVVEGAQAEKIGAVPGKPDAGALSQPLDGDFFL